MKLLGCIKALLKSESNISDVNIGDRFYSNFFDKNATVVRYENDSRWWFVLDGSTTVIRAKAKPEDLVWIEDGRE